MGLQHTTEPADPAQMRTFVRALLEDIHALERMLSEGRFERGVRRIGAEQEMFLVDRELGPAPVAMEVLAAAREGRLTTELGRFNLEANASPRTFAGGCLSAMQAEIEELVGLADRAASECSARVLLCGILPTLARGDLTLANMTPLPRYRALNDVLLAMRGGDAFRITISGEDELDIKHDNVMLEACNTSFQLHFQVAPSEFAKLYNVAQLITAPVLAAAVNSPLFMAQRLWHETRIALFSSAIDDRSAIRSARELKPRVTFGDRWVESSVLEIFREQIARFRVMLAMSTGEDPMVAIDRGVAPSLGALCLHNGTIYRWNRAVYGIHDGVAHLRIENRALPSGPTVLDEVANAAFFFGLMSGVTAEIGDPRARMDFERARENFFMAARHGLEGRLTWLDGETIGAAELISKRLLPLAREGLAQSGIDPADIDRYLGVVSERVARGRTGARWILDAYQALGDTPAGARERQITGAMLEAQHTGHPLHEWPAVEAQPAPRGSPRRGVRFVGELMSTDLFTVRPDDLVDLAAAVMEWEHVRHVPVEDGEGRLVGLVTHRDLLRLVARGEHERGSPVAIREIMHEELTTVTPTTTTLDALKTMHDIGVGCLPVVEDDKLVGLVTETDLIEVAAGLLERFLAA
jgi:CBS domain-containing protein